MTDEKELKLGGVKRFPNPQLTSIPPSTAEGNREFTPIHANETASRSSRALCPLPFARKAGILSR
jgi:hypothetical protein